MKKALLCASLFFLGYAQSVRANCSYPASEPIDWQANHGLQSAACLKEEGKKAYKDANYAYQQRLVQDGVLGWAVQTGIAATKVVGLDGLGQYIQSAASSDYLTNDVQSGLTDRFTKYRYQYNKATLGTGFSYQDVVALKRSWAELDAYLKSAEEGTKLEQEKILISRLRREGGLLTDNLSLSIILQTAGQDREKLRATLEKEFGVMKDFIDVKLKDYLQAMVDSAKPGAPSNRDPAEIVQENLQAISEISSLSQSIVSAGVMAGVLSASDATKASHLIQGVTHLSMAATMLSNSAGYTTLAGPYGLAFSGMLSLSSAFSAQRPSDSAQIMKMLAAISKQIADLQYSVDRGFTDVKNRITESEIRIMGRLSEILASNAELGTQINRFSTELASLRDEFSQERRKNQVLRIESTWANMAFRDEECLKSFGWFSKKDRESCLAYYAEALKTFLVDENPVLTGASLTGKVDYLAPDDRLFQVVESLRSLGHDYNGPAPIHGPTLERLGARIRTFLALNKTLLKTPDGTNLLKRLTDAEKGREEFTKFVSDADSVDQLMRDYDTEYSTILSRINDRLALHELNRNINRADQISFAERRDAHLPYSFRGIAAEFSRGQNSLYRLVKTGAGQPSSLTADGKLSDAEQLLHAKLVRISELATRKDSDANIYFMDAATGFYWMSPCNQQSGFPIVPIARAHLYRTLPADLVKMTMISSDNFDLCYSPQLSESNANIGAGNSTEQMDVINARFDSIGMINPRVLGHPRYCFAAPQYFATNFSQYHEYVRSTWEKCHHGHIHHELVARSPQLLGFQFTLTTRFPGYAAPIKTFSSYISVVNEYLNKCFLSFNPANSGWHQSVLMPFRQQYPLPISIACPSVDTTALQGLSQMKPQVEAFLKNEFTNRTDQIAQRVSYGDATAAIVNRTSMDFRGKYVPAVFEGIDMQRLDRLADQIAVSRFYGGKGSSKLVGYFPTSNDLMNTAQILMFDADKKQIRKADVLVRTPIVAH